MPWIVLVSACVDPSLDGEDTRASGARAQPPIGSWGVAAESVRRAGDVDGDGFEDLVAQSYYSNDYDLYLGGPSGLGTTPSATVTSATTPNFARMDADADVNGDGYDDFLVGDATWFGAPTPAYSEGRVRLFLGSAAGLAAAPVFSPQGDAPSARLGASVLLADLDGDGFAEVVATAPGVQGGRIVIWRGAVAGPAAAPSWVLGTLASALFRLGDVNGDGYEDLGALSEPAPRSLLVFHGGPGGPSVTPDEVFTPPAPLELGSATGLGDLDGDAMADLGLAAHDPTDFLAPDHVLLAHGSANGLELREDLQGVEDSVAGSAGFGAGIVGADLDGDGLSDLVVSAPWHWLSGLGSGELLAWYGGSGGLLEAWGWHASFGTTTYPGIAAVDANGDGWPEVYVPAAQGSVVLEGGSDRDQDGDLDPTDCAPDDPSLFHGRPETFYDGVDVNCDASDEYDQDGDGQDADGYGGDDCLDTDARHLGCLELSGAACPGPVSASARGLTPGARVRALRGPRGVDLLSLPCGQVYVDLERTTLLGFGLADANGVVTLPPIEVPAALCRQAVQLVDEETCLPTPRAP